MTHSIEHWARRGYRETWLDRYWTPIFIGESIAVILSFLFFFSVVFHFPDANATEINPVQLKTLKEQCAWARANKERVLNYQELMKECV